MTLYEFEKYMDNSKVLRTTYIVHLRMKYDYETEWEHTNELFEWENGDDKDYPEGWYWVNDWDEGQDQVEVLGCMDINEIEVENIFPQEAW